MACWPTMSHPRSETGRAQVFFCPSARQPKKPHDVEVASSATTASESHQRTGLPPVLWHTTTVQPVHWVQAVPGASALLDEGRAAM